MRRTLGAAAFLAFAAASAAGAAGTFDLVFRSGSLDALPQGEVLEYRQSGIRAEEAKAGDILLSIGAENTTRLTREAEGRTGEIGAFRTSVGNPIILYFMESTVRDIAEITGGSPFYIRNRFRDALTVDAPVTGAKVMWRGGEIEARRVVLRPLEGDENAARMQGLDDLEIAITVSESVPGWYHDLSAEGGAGAQRYETRIELKPEEKAR